MTAIDSALRRGSRRLARPARWRGWTTIGSLIILIALWELLAVLIHTHYFPTPWAVVVRFRELAADRLWSDVGASLRIAFTGWVLGSVVGIAVGLVLGRVRLVNLLVKPVLNFARHISPLAWVPLAILWFGIGSSSKIAVIALIAFFSLLVNTAHGAATVDPSIGAVSRMLRLHPLQRLAVLMMSTLPDILIGLRFALGASWGGVVIAELVAGDKGIGALELYGGQSYDVAQIMVGMVVLALVGLTTNWLFLTVQRIAFPWMTSSRTLETEGLTTA